MNKIVRYLSLVIAWSAFAPGVPPSAAQGTDNPPLCSREEQYFEDMTNVAASWGNGSHQQTITCPTPGAAGCSDNWGLDPLDQVAGKYAFSLLSTDAPVRIYILDTGIAGQHREFGNRVQPGVNITRKLLDPHRTNTLDCYGNSHGSHVSGIAAGNTYGAAKRAWLIPVKVAPDDCTDGQRDGNSNRPGDAGTEDFIRAIDWIIANHPAGTPAIVNYSANPDENPDEDPRYVEAVRRLAAAGILLVESAGNNEDDTGPNSFSGPGHPRESVVIVGGLDRSNRRWRRDANDSPGLCSGSFGDCGSNFGLAVDLWAPAQHIVSASNLPNSGVRRGSCRLSGTSMAAPHVTGVAAALWARYPKASPSAIKAALRQIAFADISAVSLRCNELPPEKAHLVDECQSSTNRRLSTLFPSSGAPVAGDDRFYTETGEAIMINKKWLSIGDLDWDGQTISVIAVGNPQNGSIEDLGSLIKYTPSPLFQGEDSFSYTIQDAGGLTATAQVRVVVGQKDRPPVAWTDCFELASGESREITRLDLLGNDWDPDTGTLNSAATFLEISANPDPQHGTLTETGFTDIRWRFDPASGAPDSFTASFKYVIVEPDLHRSAEGTVLLKVGPGAGACPAPLPNDPVAGLDSFTTTVGTPLSILSTELLANDTPGAVFVAAGQPAHGILSISGIAPEGVLYTYTPPAGFTGSDSFQYTIHGNLGEEAVGLATINVLGSTTIVANPDFLSTTAGQYVRVLGSELTANDTPGVEFVRAENALHGTLVIGGIGPEDIVYDFYPDPGFTGTASFEYLISPTGFPPYTRGFVTVEVADAPPVAAFTAACIDRVCSFNASGSTDDLGIASRTWTFGDGATASVAAPGHTYTARGLYLVTLEVTDTAGQTSTTSQIVTADVRPVARFTFSCAGAVCSFDATTSTDDGSLAYAWSFGDGGSGTGAVTSHTYATAGVRTVTLTVTDDVGQTDTESKETRIDLVNPTPCFTWTRDGLIIHFNASCSTDDVEICSYSWSFGDGTIGSGKNISHTYAASGPRTAMLTVADCSGRTAATSQTVNPDAKPVASFTWSCTQRTCGFNGTSSTDNLPIPTFIWNFGDGTTGSGATPTHVYAVGGPYNVTLTVTDSAGQSNLKTNPILVRRPPVAVNDSVSTPPGTAIDINVLANDSDPDNDPLTVTGLTAPTHGTVTLNGNGTVRYTPAAGNLNPATFQYRAQDAQDVSNLATVTVTLNNPPDARDDGWSTSPGNATNIPYSYLLSNDYDPNGDPLTVTGVNTAGLIGTLDCSSGTYCRYTAPGFQGATSFTYTASDGKGGTDTATVRIKVGMANGLPVPQDDILETAYNTALAFTRDTLLLNDSDPNGDVLSITSVYRAPLTALGTVSCSAAHYICTYTPPAGFTGVDVLWYRASDGIGFADARIRILVRPPSPAVLDAREDQTFFTSVGGTFLSYTWMTSNDHDPEGGALTVVSVDTTGLLGTLDCTTYPTGCQYTRGTSDPTRFRYTVRDPQGNLATTTVTLKPGNWSFNLNPVIANDQLSTRMNTPLVFSIFDVLRNDYDPDNDQLNVMFSFGSPNGRVLCSASSYVCTYTPNTNFTGTDTLTYYANDGNNAIQGTVTMTVQPLIAKDAQVLSQSVPMSMFAGRSYPVSLRIKNVGTTAWSPVGPGCNAFRLGSVNPHNNTTWGVGRTELPAPVAPGGEVTLSFTVTAPSTPGTYSFQRQMVHECVEWVGDLSPNVVVSVSP